MKSMFITRRLFGGQEIHESAIGLAKSRPSHDVLLLSQSRPFLPSLRQPEEKSTSVDRKELLLLLFKYF